MRPAFRHPDVSYALAAPCVLAALALGLACGEPAPSPSQGPADGSGSVAIEPARAVPIRYVGTWTFTYEAAGAGISAGGGVAFRVSPYWDWTAPQVERAEAPGYTTFEVEAEHARIRAISDGGLQQIVFRVKEGRLASGERLVITYANANTDSYAEKRHEFLFRVDADGDGEFHEVERQPALEILPRRPVRAWVVAPAIAAPGARVEARASLLDGLDNVVRSMRVAGEPPRIHFRDEATGLKASSNRIWPAEPDAGLQLYWGDLHGHSAWSDGTGEPEDYFRYARDVSALDFAALTDHDAVGLRPLDGPRWVRQREIAESFHADGRFVTFFGYEYTHPKTGHLTILSPSPRLPLWSARAPATNTPEKLWARLRARGLPVLTIPHHVGGSTASTDWDHHDSKFERLVEICSVHGSSECMGCPRQLRSGRRGSFVRDALVRGYRLRFIASGDSHTGHPGRTLKPFTGGLAGVWARELSREAIWEALMEGRTFATTGARIVPEFRHRGGGLFWVRVRGSSALARATIVKGSAEVMRRPVSGERIEFEWRDPQPPRTGDFYYLRVTQRDGEMAWSSPVYID